MSDAYWHEVGFKHQGTQRLVQARHSSLRVQYGIAAPCGMKLGSDERVRWLLDRSASLHSLTKKTWATFIFRRPMFFELSVSLGSTKLSMIVGETTV